MMRVVRSMMLALLVAGSCLVALRAQSPGVPETVKLWPNGMSQAQPDGGAETMRITPAGDHVVTHVAEPSITPYLPARAMATGAAVIIAPGVAAFVLRYRLAREKGAAYTVEGTELGDMQRAIRVVRSRSSEWGIDPGRVGVMGFSAGGELAALASTRSDPGHAESSDPVERMSSKPDFQALLYPAIPADAKLTAETPRSFLACGAMDRTNISQGLAEYYLALARLHVSAELHIYAGIGHGFGVRSTNKKPVADWPELFLEWMLTQGLLKAQ